MSFPLLCFQTCRFKSTFCTHWKKRGEQNYWICLCHQNIISKNCEAIKAFSSISQPWHVDTFFPHISWARALQLSSLFWLPLCCLEAQWSNRLSCVPCHCERLWGERGAAALARLTAGNVWAHKLDTRCVSVCDAVFFYSTERLGPSQEIRPPT